MKIGFDIHGVIDTYPIVFSSFSRKLKEEGHEIHIITGRPQKECEQRVRDAGVVFDHFFSIVDHHLSRKEPSMFQKDGTWWMDNQVWIRTKGDYAEYTGLDVHLDDSPEYLPFFPETCSTILVRDNFIEVFKIISEMGGL